MTSPVKGTVSRTSPSRASTSLSVPVWAPSSSASRRTNTGAVSPGATVMGAGPMGRLKDQVVGQAEEIEGLKVEFLDAYRDLAGLQARLLEP